MAPAPATGLSVLESGRRKGYLVLQILFVIPVAPFFIVSVMGQMQPMGHRLNHAVSKVMSG